MNTQLLELHECHTPRHLFSVRFSCFLSWWIYQPCWFSNGVSALWKYLCHLRQPSLIGYAVKNPERLIRLKICIAVTAFDGLPPIQGVLWSVSYSWCSWKNLLIPITFGRTSDCDSSWYFCWTPEVFMILCGWPFYIQQKQHNTIHTYSKDSIRIAQQPLKRCHCSVECGVPASHPLSQSDYLRTNKALQPILWPEHK